MREYVCDMILIQRIKKLLRPALCLSISQNFKPFTHEAKCSLLHF